MGGDVAYDGIWKAQPLRLKRGHFWFMTSLVLHLFNTLTVSNNRKLGCLHPCWSLKSTCRTRISPMSHVTSPRVPNTRTCRSQIFSVNATIEKDTVAPSSYCMLTTYVVNEMQGLAQCTFFLKLYKIEKKIGRSGGGSNRYLSLALPCICQYDGKIPLYNFWKIYRQCLGFGTCRSTTYEYLCLGTFCVDVMLVRTTQGVVNALDCIYSKRKRIQKIKQNFCFPVGLCSV